MGNSEAKIQLLTGNNEKLSKFTVALKDELDYTNYNNN